MFSYNRFSFSLLTGTMQISKAFLHHPSRDTMTNQQPQANDKRNQALIVSYSRESAPNVLKRRFVS